MSSWQFFLFNKLITVTAWWMQNNIIVLLLKEYFLTRVKYVGVGTVIWIAHLESHVGVTDREHCAVFR